ncbi:MAG: T9SS type A sorting domain-containing protein [Chitinophagaceae bacterium]
MSKMINSWIKPGMIQRFKKINWLLLCVLFLPLLSKAQLINNGATLVINTGTTLVLHNLSFQNNGVFNQSAGTVNYTGTSAATISGSISPVFFRMNINKPASTVQLQTGISIVDQLQFTNGMIDLNNNTILLGSAALLTGESETSRITGTSGGYVEITKTLNAPMGDDPGNLGAVITSSGNLGPVTIRRGHQSQVNLTGGGNSIFRYYDIIPVTNTSLNATLRFNYFDAELNGLDENNLAVYKRNGSGAWMNLSKSGGNTTTNYVERTGLPDLTRFTLSTFSNALPVKWSSFNTQCLGGTVRISWKTEQEQNTSSFIIQRSDDGRNWTRIATLPAAGNSNSSLLYTYTDPQLVAGTIYYQVQQQDFDGRLTVSPVLSNNCGALEELKVFPNPVLNDCRVSLQLDRGGALNMRLFDSKGALVFTRSESVQSGNNQFLLRLGNLAKGIYTLMVIRPDGILRVVKIEKN